METETTTSCHHGILGFCTKCDQEAELTAAKAENARMQPVFDAASEWHNATLALNNSGLDDDSAGASVLFYRLFSAERSLLHWTQKVGE